MSSVTLSRGTLTTLTCTLDGLASSTAGVGRRSTHFDNASLGFFDFEIGVRITSASSGTSATGYVTAYVYQGDGTDYETGGATDASYTVTGDLVPLLPVLPVIANSTTYYKMWRLSSLGWATAPVALGVVIVNSSGAALPTDAHFVKLRGIYQSVS